jgi:hypothetical protein
VAAAGYPWRYIKLAGASGQESASLANIVKKLKRNQANRNKTNTTIPDATWVDDDGIHYVGSGQAPTLEEYQRMTEEYQQRIRKSPLWKQMVQQYGKKQAEVMLKDFQVKPG